MSATASSDNKNIGDQGNLLLLFVAGICTLVVCLTPSISGSYKNPEFSVSDAYLDQFNYIETNHTLSYSLTLDISLTNPNRKYQFKLIDTQVFAYYQDQRFGLVTLIHRRTAFHQHPKNTTIFQNAVVQGWKTMVFEEPVLPNDAHFYRIDLVIALNKKIDGWFAHAACNQTVPLRPSFNGTSCDGFNTTECFYSPV